MMTITENTASSISQPPIDYNNYAMNRSYPLTTYDYRHQNPWDKPTYATFHPQHSTGNITSINKQPYQPQSFDTLSFPNFYRRHTESTLPTSIYSSTPFNYSPHPPGLFFGWNNNNHSSLLRTHSASYQDYPGSTSYSSQPIRHEESSQIPSNNPYPSFLNLIPPPTNFSLPQSSSASTTISNRSVSQRSIPSKVNKRPRLTADIRNEIRKLKSMKPTIFVWEIQQNLLQNGICTSQTLPCGTAIQRILNETIKPSVPIREEPKVNVKLPSSVTICLSPSPSPTLSNGETASECSICLETYRSGQEVSILACSHEYHSSCIGEWMLKSRSCPMCRKDIHNQPQFVTLLI